MTLTQSLSANRFRFRAWVPEHTVGAEVIPAHMDYNMKFASCATNTLESQNIYNGDREWRTWIRMEDIFSPKHGVTFMQSTGLTDKNGKEIFEGDVVKGVYTWKLLNGTPFRTTIYAGRIVCVSMFGRWEIQQDIEGLPEGNIDGWGLWGRESCVSSDDDHAIGADAIEVIGNIYENPDLFPSAQ